MVRRQRTSKSKVPLLQLLPKTSASSAEFLYTYNMHFLKTLFFKSRNGANNRKYVPTAKWIIDASRVYDTGL